MSEKYFTIEESLKDKVVFITGGTKGIAKAMCRNFIEAGCHVAFVSRTKEMGDEYAAELNAMGKGKALFMQCDVMDQPLLTECVEKTAETFGRLDVLVNCAGIWPLQRPIDMYTVEEYEYVLRTNLVSYFVTAKAALPYLRRTKGNIINIGSVLGTLGDQGAITYTSAKGGIHLFTKTLAIDEAKNGVRVNEVKPGHINTEMFFGGADLQEDTEGFIKYNDGLQWMGRGGTADEVARAVLFLASDWASFITGVELHVSGGFEIGEGPKLPNPYLTWGEQPMK